MGRQNVLKSIFLSFILVLLGACTSGEGVPTSTKEIQSAATKDISSLLLQMGFMERQPVQPRPNFIQAVSPEEYTIVPVDLYNYSPSDIKVVKSATGDPKDGYQSTICLRLSGEPLAQEGDDLTKDGEMGKRMGLYVNDVQMKITNSVQAGVPVITMPKDPNEIQTSWIEGDDYCWKAPLRPGEHKVVFTFRQTSGNLLEYIWYFEISE